MEFEVKRIADINRAAYNPRVDLKPEDEEYQAIERSLKRHGLVQPIVWNRRTNTVVSGHQRLTVLEAQGETEVTVSVVDLDDIKEKELNIALNKITGEWDDKIDRHPHRAGRRSSRHRIHAPGNRRFEG